MGTVTDISARRAKAVAIERAEQYLANSGLHGFPLEAAIAELGKVPDAHNVWERCSSLVRCWMRERVLLQCFCDGPCSGCGADYEAGSEHWCLSPVRGDFTQLAAAPASNDGDMR